MESTNKYIHFDWVVKRMLRDKANFAVLEGLITVLFGRKITIVEILENKEEQNNVVARNGGTSTPTSLIINKNARNLAHPP